MGTFPTLDSPNRSRPSLLAMVATIISQNNPRIHKDDVGENTRIIPTQIAIVEMRLRQQGLLSDDEQVPLVTTVGEILEALAK